MASNKCQHKNYLNLTRKEINVRLNINGEHQFMIENGKTHKNNNFKYSIIASAIIGLSSVAVHAEEAVAEEKSKEVLSDIKI